METSRPETTDITVPLETEPAPPGDRTPLRDAAGQRGHRPCYKTTAFNLAGENTSKNDVSIHLAGAMDELNAHIGLIKAKISGSNEYDDGNGRGFIELIQKNLMKIMAHGSDTANEKYFLAQAEITELEQEIRNLQKYLPDQFVLPGRNEVEAHIHIARTVARRAERHFVAAAAEKPLCPRAGIYLNRLSDYLFALACAAAKTANPPHP